jgi:uncharacterized membrane protein
MIKPSWYINESASISAFDVIIFSNMMDNCNRAFANNIHVPEKGIDGIGGGFSSGGGGFSGGGFGGGGGGSW